MTAPVPEERNDAEDLTDAPPGEHGDDLPSGEDAGGSTPTQDENAESSQGQPSQ